jgi:hypothetical protein
LKIEGGCYCGELRYQAEGEPALKGQCFCRECQYISGGDSALLLGMPEASFSYTQGTAKAFQRSDLESPVTREFCPSCGTHVASKAPGLAGVVMLKVGTLDDPSAFGGPQMAIFTCDRQPYHHVPSDIPTFERVPG